MLILTVVLQLLLTSCMPRLEHPVYYKMTSVVTSRIDLSAYLKVSTSGRYLRQDSYRLISMLLPKGGSCMWF